MTIVNRRNAVYGWVMWQMHKRVVRRVARAAVPSVDPETKRPNASAKLLAAVAATGGVLAVRRRKQGPPEPDA
jgi:hypothetical protein